MSARRPGLTGFAKCGSNYAASMAGQAKAHELGYSQVLWLDGAQRKYVEEVGSMNCFFVIDGIVRTAPCAGTVLPGITRDSCIKLLRGWDYRVDDETRLAADELMEFARARPAAGGVRDGHGRGDQPRRAAVLPRRNADGKRRGKRAG